MIDRNNLSPIVNTPKAKKPRKAMPKVTNKRAKANREYSERRKAFLIAHPYCQWWMRQRGIREPLVRNGIYVWRDSQGSHWCEVPASTEIHHMKKPKCKYLNDESTWMAVSEQGHRWIEQYKDLARQQGYLQNI